MWPSYICVCIVCACVCTVCVHVCIVCVRVCVYCVHACVCIVCVCVYCVRACVCVYVSTSLVITYNLLQLLYTFHNNFLRGPQLFQIMSIWVAIAGA